MQTNLFISASTRAGSTHLFKCFQRLGLKASSLTSVEENSAYNEEHMLDRTAADVLMPLGGLVFFQHIRAIGRNVPILRDHGVKPVVTYRNVLDCIVSWKEIHEKDIAEERGEQFVFLPMFTPEKWENLEEDDKWAWITYNVLPWMFSFYVSWKLCGLDCLFVQYSEHYKDQVAGLSRIIDWLGWEKKPTTAQLSVVSEHKDGKYAFGYTGRGRELIPGWLQGVAYDMASSWGPFKDELRQKLLEED